MNDGTDIVMPVAPAYNGGGMGGFGYGSDWWLILILLFACGGWGGFGGGFGGFGGGFGNMFEFPWLLTGQQGINANTNAGFDHAATQSAISGLQNSVTAGFGDVQLGIAGVNQNLCQTGNQITSALNNGFSQAEISNNARQIANMQTAFANQTAMNQGFNGLQSQLAQCCCDNRLASCQTQNIIQNEGNATRFADANNTRDIITNQTQNTQSILDKLCQLELDGYKRENDQLRSQLQFANMQASQVDQTAQLRANQATVANQLVSELRSCPIPAQPVFGNQPIFTCAQNVAGSSCACGNF